MMMKYDKNSNKRRMIKICTEQLNLYKITLEKRNLADVIEEA